jgi:cytochrome c2
MERTPGAGERAYLKCYSCHSVTSGETLEGPDLAGIVGAPIAARPGFDYSPAFIRFAKANPVWTEELLDRFIADPEAVVPGTSMAFAGVGDPAERAAIIAYLEKTSQP